MPAVHGPITGSVRLFWDGEGPGHPRLPRLSPDAIPATLKAVFGRLHLLDHQGGLAMAYRGENKRRVKVRPGIVMMVLLAIVSFSLSTSSPACTAPYSVRCISEWGPVYCPGECAASGEDQCFLWCGTRFGWVEQSSEWWDTSCYPVAMYSCTCTAFCETYARPNNG